jgi:hypothetical protein
VKKLFRLKDWVTLPSAAEHLSSIFNESVSVADILQLGLDGHLQLSVNFVNKVRARLGKAVPVSEARLVAFSKTNGELSGPVNIPDLRVSDELPSDIAERVNLGSIVLTIQGIDIGNEQILELTEEIKTLEDIWDLPMIGAERLDVEHMFQRETDGPEVTLISLNGAFVARPNGDFCQLREHFPQDGYDSGKTPLPIKDGVQTNTALPGKKPRSIDDADSYYPAPGLPKDSVIVVRTSALADLANRVSGHSLDRPLAERERATLLTIIAALAKSAKIDWRQPSKAGLAIEKLTIDLDAAVSVRTIEEHLKRIPDALERRR